MIKRALSILIALLLPANLFARIPLAEFPGVEHYMEEAVKLRKAGKLTPEAAIFDFRPLSADNPQERRIDSLFRKANRILDEQGDCFEGFFYLDQATLAAEDYYGRESELYAEYYVYHYGRTYTDRCLPPDEYDVRPWLSKELETWRKAQAGCTDACARALADVRRLARVPAHRIDWLGESRDTMPAGIVDALGLGHIEIINALERQVVIADPEGRKMMEHPRLLMEHYDELARHYEAAYGHLSWQRLSAERRRIMAYRDRSYSGSHPGYNPADLERARRFMVDWEAAGLVKTFAYWQAVYEIAMLEFSYSQDAVRAAYLASSALLACEYKIRKLYVDSCTFPLDYMLTRALLESGRYGEAEKWAVRETMYGCRLHGNVYDGTLPPDIRLDMAYARGDWDSCESIASGIFDGWEQTMTDTVDDRIHILRSVQCLKPLSIWMESRSACSRSWYAAGKSPLEGLPLEIVDAAEKSVRRWEEIGEWYDIYSALWRYERHPEEFAPIGGEILEAMRQGLANIEGCHFARQSMGARMCLEYLLNVFKIHSAMGAMLYNGQKYEQAAGQLESAKMCLDMLDHLSGYLTHRHRDEIGAARALRRYHQALGKIADKAEYARISRRIFEEQTERLRRGFAMGVKEDRSRYYALNEGLFTFNMAAMPVIAGEQPESRALAYDNALFVKGLQLNAELSLMDFLLKNGDTRAVEDLRLLQSIDVSKPGNIERKKQLERSVVDRSLVYGDYTDGLFTNWQQVRDALHPGEAAVEIVELPDWSKTYSVYYALTLLPGALAPEYDYLGYGKTLAGFDFKTVYTTDSLARKVWKPILRHLDGVSTVFFSPSGVFNNIAIEHLPPLAGAEGVRFCRLSSTRQLCRRDKAPGNFKKLVAFGGADFEGRLTSVAGNAGHRSSSPGVYDSTYLENLGLRAGYGYLPGTLAEVNMIGRVLGRKRVEVFTGGDATESRFKALSGSGVEVVHVATHGFYWNERDLRRNRNLSFLNTGVDMEDRSLNRSGLLLAGVNRALNGDNKAFPDDGILTAKELSALDLSSVRLAVLSACQTGLGDITAEGVFGLQRGLKKAGVQSILMSLWKVDDDATRILMSEFYTQISKGVPLREALTSARDHLRTVAGYDSPEYWAGFVLLD